MTRGARTADEAKAEGDLAPVTYNYAFFHLIFALASTYIAMLMTGARARTFPLPRPPCPTDPVNMPPASSAQPTYHSAFILLFSLRCKQTCAAGF